jgi:serine/threonine protein kinase
MQMAAWKRSGRASDMFSLGCVLLEVVVLHDQGTLQQVRLNRSADPSFHANLDRVNTWLEVPSSKPSSFRRAYLASEIKSMLANDPEARPTAKELLFRVTGYDQAQMITSTHSLFGVCCRSYFISSKEKEREISGYANTINDIHSDLQKAHEELVEKEQEFIRVVEEHAALSALLLVEQAGSNSGVPEYTLTPHRNLRERWKRKISN